MSEPYWVGKAVNDTESELTRSQEDSLGETERLQIEVYRMGRQCAGYDFAIYLERLRIEIKSGSRQS